ncbi:MAG: hypothetical protein ACYTG6_07645 [Planctomycetota bacterium]|jgi:hypothetical protein
MVTMRRFVSAILVLLPSAGALAAPAEFKWRLGADDFVAYEIKVLERSDSRLDGYARWGEIDDVAGFHGYELDEKGRRVTRPITHPQLLYTPFVFTLPRRPARNTRLAFREVLPVNWRLMPIKVRGHVKVAALEHEGETPLVKLEGEVDFEPGRAEDGEIAYRELDAGSLRWTSIFDLQRGLMTEVEYVLQWETSTYTDHRPDSAHGLDPRARTHRARVRLTLDRVMTYRYPGFQREIDDAIDEGLQSVEANQGEDGSWRETRKFGMTALALLTLLDGGRGADHPAVSKGFDWLLSQRPWVAGETADRTYGIGVALMALERWRTPQEEIDRRRRGVRTEFLPRQLTGGERAWMQRCVDFLLETARVKRADQPGRAVTGDREHDHWRWGYPRDPPPGTTGFGNYWDNSNTQYAVLGLESAARCEIRIPEYVWLGIAAHFLAVQAPDGPERKAFPLRSHDERPRGGTDEEGVTVAPLAARERGWQYQESRDPEPGRPPTGLNYGAMTAAGIGSLAIARSRIEDLPRARHHEALLARIDQAIVDGFASLDRMFTVWTHPRYQGWYTYYAYGLERAGMLADVWRFGIHDWYWEGAVQFLLRQSDYGVGGPQAWSYDLGTMGTTCWVILFLKRGTPPVITPR